MLKNESFGIMDQGYFKSRQEILRWVNGLLGTSLQKIQELGSGVVYCQLLNLLFPGKLPISKVNEKAKHDYQFIANLKLFQTGLEKSGVKKHIEIEKLARAKYQDNLELIQWLKRFFQVNGKGDCDFAKKEPASNRPSLAELHNPGNIMPDLSAKTPRGKPQLAKPRKSFTQAAKGQAQLKLQQIKGIIGREMSLQGKYSLICKIVSDQQQAEIL